MTPKIKLKKPFTKFLDKQDLWAELRRTVEQTDRETDGVRFAVAYWGTGGAELLPLKKGDRLLVDLSMQTVGKGSTNPVDLETLLNREEVSIFTSDSIHAKFMVTKTTLIVGSANVSRRSKGRLDEAGMMTTDPVAIRRARDYFDDLCLEPVGPESLAECIKAYRPPPAAQHGRGGSALPRMWFIPGLLDYTPKTKDRRRLDRAAKNAERSRYFEGRGATGYIVLPYAKALERFLRPGQLIIQGYGQRGVNGDVHSPVRILSVDAPWTDADGDRCISIHYESPRNERTMPFREFAKAMRALSPNLAKWGCEYAVRKKSVADTVLKLMR